MNRFWRFLALVISGISFFALDAVVWWIMHLPPGIDAATVEVNHALVPWGILIRGFITFVLIWTFLYLNAHCVIASREESTRIITKG